MCLKEKYISQYISFFKNNRIYVSKVLYQSGSKISTQAKRQHSRDILEKCVKKTPMLTFILQLIKKLFCVLFWGFFSEHPLFRRRMECPHQWILVGVTTNVVTDSF